MIIKYLFCSVFAICTLSCIPKGKLSDDILLTVADCMPDRKDDGRIDSHEGAIQLISGSYVIQDMTDQGRYVACNLPENYQREGLSITFSLIKKEIYHNERRLAIPAVLQNLIIKKQ